MNILKSIKSFISNIAEKVQRAYYSIKSLFTSSTEDLIEELFEEGAADTGDTEAYDAFVADCKKGIDLDTLGNFTYSVIRSESLVVDKIDQFSKFSKLEKLMGLLCISNSSSMKGLTETEFEKTEFLTAEGKVNFKLPEKYTSLVALFNNDDSIVTKKEVMSLGTIASDSLYGYLFGNHDDGNHETRRFDAYLKLRSFKVCS